MSNPRCAEELLQGDGLRLSILNLLNQEARAMKFSPCVPDRCTKEGTHCEGCGRSHEEIAETKQLIMALVGFAQRQGYENVEEFSQFVGRTLLAKLQPVP